MVRHGNDSKFFLKTERKFFYYQEIGYISYINNNMNKKTRLDYSLEAQMLRNFHEHDELAMRAYGWTSHCVPSGDRTPYGGFNYHTHGFEQSYDHRNIQIVFPLAPVMCHQLATMLVDAIKTGRKFEPEVDYFDMLANEMPLRFIEAKECGRPVLRMLICSPQKDYSGQYAEQFEKLDNNEGLSVEEQTNQTD